MSSSKITGRIEYGTLRLKTLSSCLSILSYSYVRWRSVSDDGEGGRDAGPKGELEYWRNRMQRLTSITEQLKRKVLCSCYNEQRH